MNFQFSITNFQTKRGFTFIELLVTMSIIGVLAALVLFASAGVREQGRDARRKTDLELIRSGLEIYRSDCKDYPASITTGGSLIGDGSPTSCSASNTYISKIPADPQSPTRTYFYSRPTTTTYLLCARLEQAPNPAVDVTGCDNNCGGACNWKVISP